MGKIVDALRNIQWKDHCNLDGRTNLDDKPLSECQSSEISGWVDSGHAKIVQTAVVADAFCDRLENILDKFADRDLS